MTRSSVYSSFAMCVFHQKNVFKKSLLLLRCDISFCLHPSFLVIGALNEREEEEYKESIRYYLLTVRAKRVADVERQREMRKRAATTNTQRNWEKECISSMLVNQTAEKSASVRLRSDAGLTGLQWIEGVSFFFLSSSSSLAVPLSKPFLLSRWLKSFVCP